MSEIAAVGTAQRRAQDREMILDPFKWPHLVLPIKRMVDGRMQTAIVYAGMEKLKEDEPIQVKLNTTIFGDVGEDSKLTTFKDVDALLDDGWTVD